MPSTKDPTGSDQDMLSRLEAYFRKHIRNAAMAPDLAQKVLVKFRSIKKTTIENPDRYLFRMAAREAGRQRVLERWEQENLLSLSDADAPDIPAPPSQSPEPLIFDRAWQRVLDKLDELSQNVLTLWLNDATYEEIAEATSLTVNQVRHNLRETFALLRSLLNDDPKERN